MTCKRPDYGNATPRDLAWMIMTGRPVRDRYPLSRHRDDQEGVKTSEEGVTKRPR